MARGNPDNLRAAATRKSEHATERAETALRALIKRGDPITFRGVATEAGCSPDFLYNSRTLRPRIEHLRHRAQLTALKKQHHDELAALNTALTAAHGELLQLRRQLGPAGLHAARPTG